jgi:hypothetical protein
MNVLFCRLYMKHVTVYDNPAPFDGLFAGCGDS